jgi:hypothetical protein
MLHPVPAGLGHGETAGRGCREPIGITGYHAHLRALGAQHSGTRQADAGTRARDQARRAIDTEVHAMMFADWDDDTV